MLVDRVRQLCLIMIPVCTATVHLAAFADAQPPAGQQCPAGAYVTGFDLKGNILCSEPVRDAGAKPDNIPEDGQVKSGTGTTTAGALQGTATDPTDRAETAVIASTAAAVAPTDSPPVIAKVVPWSVVYGKREVAVVISGSGFTADSTVVFNGQRHAATVNDEGTELRVTLNTAGLAIGQYPIRVINGPGAEAVLKRGVVVY